MEQSHLQNWCVFTISDVSGTQPKSLIPWLFMVESLGAFGKGRGWDDERRGRAATGVAEQSKHVCQNKPDLWHIRLWQTFEAVPFLTVITRVCQNKPDLWHTRPDISVCHHVVFTWIFLLSLATAQRNAQPSWEREIPLYSDRSGVMLKLRKWLPLRLCLACWTDHRFIWQWRRLL